MEQSSVAVRPTNSQLRIWFLHELDPMRTDLTIACAARLRHPMDVAGLHSRLRAVVEADPMLAVTVEGHETGPVLRQVPVEDAVGDALLSTVRVADVDRAREHYRRFVDRPWQPGRSVPWAVQLVSIGEDAMLFCRFHHLVCDGDRSLELFLDRLCADPAAGHEVHDLAELLEEPHPGDDEVAAAAADLASATAGMADVRARLAAPVDGGIRRWTGVLDPSPHGEVSDTVRVLERLRGPVTALGRGGPVVAAVPVDGVTAHQRERIGYFGNPGLAVLPDEAPADERAWADAELTRALTRARVPFQQVMADDGYRTAVGGRTPFDVLVVPRTLFSTENELVESVVEPVASTTPYALVVNHWRDGRGRLVVGLESPVFADEVLVHLGDRMTGSPAERRRPPERSVPGVMELVERRVEEIPDVVAVETACEERLTYRELWDQAGLLADRIRPAMGPRHRTVAVIGDKQASEIVAMLAVHRLGGTVLRLDRGPGTTLRALGSVPGVAATIRLHGDLALTSPDEEPAGPVGSGPFGQYRVTALDSDPDTSVDPDDDAPLYITLTSGSTGEPKPVPFGRTGFAAMIDWHVRSFPGPRRMLQFSRLSFDVAFHTIYATLCGGGTLVLANTTIRDDPRQLLDYLASARIEKLYLPTVLLGPLAETAMAGTSPTVPTSLREVIVAGGALEVTDAVRGWFGLTGAQLFNHYGMSETQDVTCNQLAGLPSEWPDRPSAGQPIDGVDIAVIDDRGDRLPATLTGSIVVRTCRGDTRTGDAGMIGQDGHIHVVGREDRVVKRRGFRVNLEALESRVRAVPGVADAAAVSYVDDSSGVTGLAVLAVGDSAVHGADATAVASEIAGRLGAGYDFRLHLVDALPRLANAKPDLVAMARTARELGEPAPVAPGTRADRPVANGYVADAVRELVGDVEVHDRARFLDLGLDSITLMSLAARLRAAHPDVGVADLFRHPTIGDLQRHLDGGRPAEPATATPRALPARGSTSVSVVGLACRFPDAPDADAFWNGLLTSGDPVPAPVRDGFVRAHGNLDGVDEFDHTFFGITPAEARRTDPQVRLFLQLCWTALEDAGLAGDLDGHSVGVFAGAGLSTYLINQVEPQRATSASGPFLEYNTLPERLGNDRNYLSSTVSYRLGLTGPSLVVQAACATSLSAVHAARRALLDGECDVAIAGGVSVIYPQPDGYRHVEGSVRSGSGVCRPFDQDADGTVFGNGAGVVVLTRAEDSAVRGHSEYARLLGSAVNHDGAIKGSFSAPNPLSQTRVVDAALAGAGDVPGLDFVEAHGTGTAVGDLIEWDALRASRVRGVDGACIVGSVKGHVGHLDEAAGVAGLIKACLAVRNRVLPGTRGFAGLHPQLTASQRLSATGTAVPLATDRPVYAGVSSFGMGGANCHVVLRSPDPVSVDQEVEVGPTEPMVLRLPVSAPTEDGLTRLADVLTGHLAGHGQEIRDRDVVRTLTSGRRHFEEHRGVLRTGDGGGGLVPAAGTGTGPMIWAFPGQGSGFRPTLVAALRQWPAFAHTFDRMLAAFAERLGVGAFAAHLGAPGADGIPSGPDGDCAERCTVREQVLQFTLQRSLAALLESFGLTPDTVVGHSLGEISAAVVAARLTERDAVALVAERALRMEDADDGVMMLLQCGRDRAEELACGTGIDVAALNGPSQTVLSGPRSARDALHEAAEAAGVSVTDLAVPGAFHSRLMAAASEHVAALQPAADPGPGRVGFISSNGPHAGKDAVLDPHYWARQLTAPVDWVAACRGLPVDEPLPWLLELGNGSTLVNLLRAVAAADGSTPPHTVGGLREDRDWVTDVLGAGYGAGSPVDWAAVNRQPAGHLVSLPGYPFARTVVPPLGPSAETRSAEQDTVLELRADREEWLTGHRVLGQPVVPAAAVLALFARTVRGGSQDDVELRDVTFERPVVIGSTDDVVEARVRVSGPDREITLSTRTASGDVWTRNASATVAVPQDAPEVDVPARPDGAVPRRAEDVYRRFARQHLTYGPAYRGLHEILLGPDAATARWTRTGSVDGSAIGLDPADVAELDGMLQLTDTVDAVDAGAVRMPAHVAMARLRTAGGTGRRVHAVSSTDHPAPRSVLTTDDGGLVAELDGIRFEAAPDTVPIAHRTRWHPAVRDGELPAAVEDAVNALESRLSEPDIEVAAYQEQMARIEAHARAVLAAAPAPPAGTDTAAGRRARRLAELAEQGSRSAAPTVEPSTPIEAEWAILRHCAERLDRFADGTADGAAILFEGEGAAHLRRYYQSSFLLGRMNTALREVVAAKAAATPGRPLRVLEVGGGTGASTEGVLETLAEAGVDVLYTFTDVSPGLLAVAQDRFGDEPGFCTAEADLDSEESMSALPADQDVIIGVDVVHATHDLDASLRRLAGRMAADGTFLLVEDLTRLAWVDATFGLLDSWWSHTDDVRGDHPLLDPDRWADVLADRFGRVRLVRACAGTPFEDVVADEGLFVCGRPVRDTAAAGTLELSVADDMSDLAERVDRAAEDARSGMLVVRWDCGDVGVCDPGDAEWFVGSVLTVLRRVEHLPGIGSVVLCTTDADGTGPDAPRVLPPGSMAAALARVAAAEDRSATVVALAVEPGTPQERELDAARSLLAPGSVAARTGVLVDGTLHLPRVEPVTSPVPQGPLPHDSLVVFGGEGDLARAVVEELVDSYGVDWVVLVGRGDPRPSTDEFRVRMLRRGVQVRYERADVTDPASVRAAAAAVRGECSRPLVLHLAAVLQDATIDRADDETVQAVLEPKVRGGHAITQAFVGSEATVVTFSSTSVLLGNAGQAAHAAACAYLDGLAAVRGPAAVRVASVQWGPWDEVGITNRSGWNDALRRSGETPLPPIVLAPELVRAALAPGRTTVAADLSAQQLRRGEGRRALLPAPPAEPRRRVVPRTGTAERHDTAPAADGGVAPVRAAVAEVLGVPAPDLDGGCPLVALGIDSLSMIEVRSSVERRSGVRVPLNELADASSLDEADAIVAGPSATTGGGAPTVHGPPLFYVAGIFGGLDAAPDLEQAVADRARLVTLSSPTRTVGAQGRLDVVEVARDLADRIERDQPTGPIHLVGHSFGAMLAFSAAVELRRRDRTLARLVVLDGDPVPGADAHTAAADSESFDRLIALGAAAGRVGSLSDGSREVARTNYLANCAIARSPQIVDELGCPIVIGIPEQYVGVGIRPDQITDLCLAAREKWGGTSVEQVAVPGDHFTMLRSPNAEQIVTHLL